MKEIRVTKGYGSNPKAWAVLRESGKPWEMAGEFDLSDEPGWYDEEADGINGMSGIIWVPGKVAEVYPRKLYNSMAEWVSDISAVYPDAGIVIDMATRAFG